MIILAIKKKKMKIKQRNLKLQFLNIPQHHLLMIQKEINSEHGTTEGHR